MRPIRQVPARSSWRHACAQVINHVVGDPRRAEAISSRLFRRSRVTLRREVLAELSAKGSGTFQPIERRRDLPLPEFRARYLRRGVPVILEGAARAWPCTREWSLDAFRALHGDAPVRYASGGREHRAILGDLIQRLRASPGSYLTFYPLFEEHPARRDEVDHAWLVARRDGFAICRDFQLFVGARGSVTGLHTNVRSNLFVQAHGEKEWILFPNAYRAVFDPFRIDGTVRVPSPPFDPFETSGTSETAGLPGAGGEPRPCIDGLRGVLAPGDVLFNPPYSWHAVRNLSESIGIGYRWISPWRAFRASPLYFTLDMLLSWPPVGRLLRLYRRSDLVRTTLLGPPTQANDARRLRAAVALTAAEQAQAASAGEEGASSG